MSAISRPRTGGPRYACVNPNAAPRDRCVKAPSGKFENAQTCYDACAPTEPVADAEGGDKETPTEEELARAGAIYNACAKQYLGVLSPEERTEADDVLAQWRAELTHGDASLVGARFKTAEQIAKMSPRDHEEHFAELRARLDESKKAAEREAMRHLSTDRAYVAKNTKGMSLKDKREFLLSRFSRLALWDLMTEMQAYTMFVAEYRDVMEYENMKKDVMTTEWWNSYGMADYRKSRQRALRVLMADSLPSDEWRDKFVAEEMGNFPDDSYKRLLKIYAPHAKVFEEEYLKATRGELFQTRKVDTHAAELLRKDMEARWAPYKSEDESSEDSRPTTPERVEAAKTVMATIAKVMDDLESSQGSTGSQPAPTKRPSPSLAGRSSGRANSEGSSVRSYSSRDELDDADSLGQQMELARRPTSNSVRSSGSSATSGQMASSVRGLTDKYNSAIMERTENLATASDENRHAVAALAIHVHTLDAKVDNLINLVRSTMPETRETAANARLAASQAVKTVSIFEVIRNWDDMTVPYLKTRFWEAIKTTLCLVPLTVFTAVTYVPMQCIQMMKEGAAMMSYVSNKLRGVAGIVMIFVIGAAIVVGFTHMPGEEGQQLRDDFMGVARTMASNSMEAVHASFDFIANVLLGPACMFIMKYINMFLQFVVMAQAFVGEYGRMFMNSFGKSSADGEGLAEVGAVIGDAVGAGLQQAGEAVQDGLQQLREAAAEAVKEAVKEVAVKYNPFKW